MNIFKVEINLSLLYYECCIITKIRKRQPTLINDISVYLDINKSQVQVDRMQGTWEQACIYCSKNESRVLDTKPSMSKNNTLGYTGQDIDFLSKPELRYPWQTEVFDKIFSEVPITLKDPDDRTIIWIEDTFGNTGKSKFVKCLQPLKKRRR